MTHHTADTTDQFGPLITTNGGNILKYFPENQLTIYCRFWTCTMLLRR